MTQDNSGKKTKNLSGAPQPINPLPPSLSDARGLGRSGGPRYRSNTRPPDWPFWKKIRAVRVWQAVLLSLDIDPDGMEHSRTAWMAGPGGDPVFEDRCFPSDTKKNEYGKRLRLVKPEITNPEHFYLHQIIMNNPAECEIYLKDFAKWALSIELGDMPSELVAMAVSPIQNPAPLTQPVIKPTSRFTAQDEAILEAIRAKGLRPKALPKSPKGKPGVKSEIKAALIMAHKNIFVSAGVFDDAWQRLRSNGEIKEEI